MMSQERTAHSAARSRTSSAGFILLEVLLSMTLLAIAGTVMLRSIQNSIDAARKSQEMTRVVFLAKIKLHELEMGYYEKPDAPLGRFEGVFTQDKDFQWQAFIERDNFRDAYLITVWAKKIGGLRVSPRNRRSQIRNEGFMLKTLVPTSRYNEMLVRGNAPGYRGNRGRGGGRR